MEVCRCLEDSSDIPEELRITALDAAKMAHSELKTDGSRGSTDRAASIVHAIHEAICSGQTKKLESAMQFGRRPDVAPE